MPVLLMPDIAHLLEMVALALSIFNLVAFLWLACTVWLNGDRRSMIARVGVVGLSLTALFFFVHSLIISSSPSQVSGLVTPDFLWYLIWLPTLGVPYIWFVIGLHYASLINDGWRKRRPLLLICSGVLGCGVLILLMLNQETFTLNSTLRLLAYSEVRDPGGIRFLSPVVLLPALFLCYVTFCVIGPWFTPARVGRLLRALGSISAGRKGQISVRQRLSDAFWDDHGKMELLEEPVLSWHLARPLLLLAALLMVGLTTSLGGLGIWSMVNWLQRGGQSSAPGVLLEIPLNLVMLDIFTVGTVAIISLLVGYSIMRHGILIERPLARRGFFEQWRGIVIVATAIAIFIAVLVELTRSSLGSLLLITSLATGAYALFTWSSYTAHDRYIALLRPFLRSTNLRHWLNTDLQKTEQNMQDLFFHLCSDVLEVRFARLVVLAGPVRRGFNYRWPSFDERDETEEYLIDKKIITRRIVRQVRQNGMSRRSDQLQATGPGAYRVRMLLQGIPLVCWVLPIYDELGPVARLYLGPRQDGAIFTDEDMDLAQACGQRILDTLRDHEAMLAVAGLLRRRTIDVKLLGAQQRRVLHDEILPQMHLTLLRLETLRSFISGKEDQAIKAHAHSALEETVASISDAHRRLANMMRATATSAPHRLERDGLMQAIRTMIAQDFQQAFDEVEWRVPEKDVACIDERVPPAIAELIFAAVQEALRNAARHARGSDVHRRLRIVLKASFDPDLEVMVIDDGVGIVPASSTTGTAGGLLTHSALLAIAGGSLTIKSAPDEGVTMRILLPAESLR